MICRVYARKEAGKNGWILELQSQPALALADRHIGTLEDGTAQLPVPPAGEAAEWNGKPHAALCNAADFQTIDAVYRRILENNPVPGELAVFASYLTAVLLGPNLMALEAAADPVDLRICFEDSNLLRLPWEMMYGPGDTAGAPDAPLSARPNRRIAINREVPLAPGDPGRQQPVSDCPLRILFVAESKIDDVLRPGAEFLGLLRHLRIPSDRNFTNEFVSAGIRLRFLPEGDIDVLKKECAFFRPTVLHFICHGEADPGGGPARIVLRKREAGDAEGESAPHSISADELVDHLTENGGWLPPVIVLNACYTASVPGQASRVDDVHLPFAAQLVRRGSAIAVGMAGEVADPACQMFTLRFYQALLTRTPILYAASQARRAVLTAWPAYQQSIEWARPALFIASGLNGTIDANCASQYDLITAAERFRKTGNSPRMMCDRYDMMAAYDRLVTMAEKPGSGKLIAAIPVEDTAKGIGKTRILEEFAVRSVMDRFLPLIVRAEGEMPRSLLDFALVLTDAINETRRNFGLERIEDTESRLKAMDVLELDPPDTERKRTLLKLRSSLKNAASVICGPGEILDAIRADCARLGADIGKITGYPHRVMILIDELHRWDSAYKEFLDSVDFAGLGTIADPIPVVVNYLSTSAEGTSIQQKLKFLPVALRPPLRRFETDIEREMVYRHLLLSEYQKAPRQSRESAAKVKDFFSVLHKRTGGVPLQFIDPKIEGFIDGVALAADYLISADYEDALRNYGN